MDIAAMLLWIFTAAAGVSLLAARRPARGSGEPAPAPRPAGVPPEAAAAYAAGAKVPPISNRRVTTQPGEHPLLEFMHPALGIVGLGCWIGFVFTRFRAFAWVALGVIVVTIAAGVAWYAVNTRAARAAPAAGAGAAARAGEAAGPGRDAGTGAGTAAGRYPARRLLIHGSAATVTLVLAIVTALIAYHA